MTPHTCQGHHRPARSTTRLAGEPVRGTKGLPGAPQACQGHHLSNRDSGTQACQRHHGVVRGTTVPSRGTSAPQTCQGHHRLIRGTTERPRDPTYLSGAPQTCQEHHRPCRGTTQRHHEPARGTTCPAGAPGGVPGGLSGGWLIPVRLATCRGGSGCIPLFYDCLVYSARGGDLI